MQRHFKTVALLSFVVASYLHAGTVSVDSRNEGDQGKHIEKSITKDKTKTQSKETVYQNEQSTNNAKSDTKTSTKAQEKSTSRTTSKSSGQQSKITKTVPVTALLQDELEYMQMLISLRMKKINAVLTNYQNAYHSLSMPLRGKEINTFFQLATFSHPTPLTTFKDPKTGKEKFDLMTIPEYQEQELIEGENGTGLYAIKKGGASLLNSYVLGTGLYVTKKGDQYYLISASVLGNDKMGDIASGASYTGRIITTDGSYYKTLRFTKEGQLPDIVSNESMPDTSSFFVTNFDYQNKYSGRINIKNDGETFNIKFLDTESSTNYEINPIAGTYQEKRQNFIITEYSANAYTASFGRFTYKNDLQQNDITITDNGQSSGTIGYAYDGKGDYAMILLLWKYKEALDDIVKSGKTYSEAELLYKLRERAYCETLDNECAEKFSVVYASETDPFNPMADNGFRVKSKDIFAKTMARQYGKPLKFSTYRSEAIFDKNTGSLFGQKFNISIETTESIEKAYTDLFRKSDTSAFASQIAKTVSSLQTKGENEKVDMLKTLAVRFAESKDFNMKKQQVLSVSTDSQIFSKLLALVK